MPVSIIRQNADEGTSNFRLFVLAPDAAAQVRALGFKPQDITDRARRAARYQDTIANFRHKDLTFLIRDGTILGVWAIGAAKNAPQQATSAILAPITAACPVCEGEGCHECGGRGVITRTAFEWERLRLELSI